MRIYCVGGSVRDQLLGRTAADRDYVVLGSSEEAFRQRFPQAKRLGRDKPVFLADGREYTLSSEPDIRSDLARRDLTINALARDMHGQFHALDRSLEDLRQRRLRPVSADSFWQDPLRVFRAARLYACLQGFEPHQELLDVMRGLSGSPDLGLPAAERVGSEVRKACACPCPGRFPALLARTGTLDPWLREVGKALAAGGGPQREAGAGRPISDLARLLDSLAGEELVVWMGLCAWLVLPPSWTDPVRRQPAEAALRLAERLRLPRRHRREGALAAAWTAPALSYPRLPAEARLDVLEQLRDRGRLRRMAAVVRALSGRDILEQTRRDLERIEAVRLPARARGLGPESGRLLRALRLEALNAP